MAPGCTHHCHCEERSDVAISWYHFTHCTALLEIVPGDCHGPKGPRNDTVTVTQVRSRYCAKQQFIFLKSTLGIYIFSQMVYDIANRVGVLA